MSYNYPYRPLRDFVDKISRREPLTFSRWGDGEWWSVFGRVQGRNCDAHQYFPQMGQDLKNVLLSRPPYVLGMQSLAVSMFKGKIAAWLQANNLQDLDWVNADVFHEASEAGQLGPLVDLLKARTLVMVGPPHLRPLEKMLHFHEFVEVPRRNSYVALAAVREQLFRVHDSVPYAIVSVSAGMPGKLLVDQLYQRRPQATILDCGSLWDYYVGVNSRKYMRRMPPPPPLPQD